MFTSKTAGEMKRDQKAFTVLNPNAAGIDISSKGHHVAVSPDVTDHPVREFKAYTEDLYEIVAWLRSCKVDTVAMEATGIYWVSLFLILEEAGFEVLLVNAKHVKNVRGKKTDMKDAEWIRQLHSCGLLSASFQPDKFTRKLRTYMRHRKNLIEMSATHIRMMQKAFEQMNIKLQHVIADITGKSGRAIIQAILNGERNPENMLLLLDGRVKASHDDIKKSLQGVWKDEHIFELRQSYEMYEFYRIKITECDKEVEKLMESQMTKKEPPAHTKKIRSNKNNLNFDASKILTEILGTDVTQIVGINDSSAIELISEIGTNMDKWSTAKNFTSWLNLAPNNRISGGKILSSKIPKKKNRAGQIFRMAAFAVQRSKHWLATFYHRIKSKGGTKKAITATARKIAVIFYTMVKNKAVFNPVPTENYYEMLKVQQLKRLKKQALKLGFVLAQGELVT